MNDNIIILIMLYLLYRNNEQIKVNEIENRFLKFFNKEIRVTEILKSLQLLKDEKYIFIDDETINLTNEGLKRAHFDNIEYYFKYAIKYTENLSPEIKYQKYKNEISLASDSIIDYEQLSFILDNLENKKGLIVDVGCGRGYVTNYLQEKSACNFIGLDNSHEMVKIAKDNFHQINWICDSFESIEFKDNSIDVFLLLDSIYFAKDPLKLIKKLQNSLVSSGKIIISYSEYLSSDKNIESLNYKNNKIGKVLSNFKYKAHNFTLNEKKLWSRRINILEKLREEYQKLNSEYFYYDKIIEAKNLFEKVSNNQSKRYLYVIDK